MKINIIGNGVWGTALGKLSTINGHEISFWDQKSQIEPLNAVVIAIPAQVIRIVLEKYGSNLKSAVIINSAKGIEKISHKLPFQIIKELLGEKIEYFTLMGPSFAQEVNDKMPTLVNLGGRNGRTQTVSDLFETDYFRVRPTGSVEALELAGALKNVYAIACGIADGLGFKENTKAKLITIAYEEFQKLALKLNYKIDERARPGILGDLVLTCGSTESRNFRFGKDLTKYSISESIAKINSTIEGYNTAFSVAYFSKMSAMPLGKFVFKVIKKDNPKRIGSEFADFVRKI
ncbi:MAG: Glycerol-3-phosphate dehydrogenase [Candidatus Levybacteria bacterium]|nr:Glycerol-3-phosphate dehydrogenase [Candidatus Levybacteria bacterium]